MSYLLNTHIILCTDIKNYVLKESTFFKITQTIKKYFSVGVVVCVCGGAIRWWCVSVGGWLVGGGVGCIVCG